MALGTLEATRAHGHAGEAAGLVLRKIYSLARASLRVGASGLVYAPAPTRRRTPRLTRQHAHQRSN
jgi:hypothetical protein